MPNKNNNNNVPAQTPALSRLAIFGPIPLLPGENAAAYDDLLARVSGNLKPSDIFEEIWVREIVDLIWESLRWRRHLVGFLATAIPKTLERILKPLAQNQPEAGSGRGSFIDRLHAAEASLKGGSTLVTDWAAGDPTAIERVNKLLASAGLTMDNVIAQTTASELEKIERFNRLIASAEWRRNTLLREIDRRRASFAQKVRSEIHRIEDAEFKTIEADTSAANQDAVEDAA
jgi:hypothetical protein